MRGAVSAALLFAALVGMGAAPPKREPRSIPLDLEVDRDPVVQGRTLRLFGLEERNQRMDLDRDTAPDCSPIPIGTALQPVGSGGAVFALDRSGALWRLADGFPKTADQVPAGAVALLPGQPLPAVLYADHLRLPSGVPAPLPLRAEGGCPAGEGWWVRGGGEAALLKADGTTSWTWKPAGLHPTDACVSGDRVFAGTQEGGLVALDDSSGRERWRYRTGGAVAAPVAAPGGGVVLASADHALRRLNDRGQLVWQKRLTARLAWPPLPCGGGWLVAEQAGRRVALIDGRSGKQLWSWDAPGGEILRPPVLAGDELCVLVSAGEAHPTLWIVPVPSAEGKKGRD